MRRTKRGGWPYSQAPNISFDVNWDSPQAKGLVMWMPLRLPSLYPTLVDQIAGGIFAPTGTPAWVSDSRFGTAILFDDGVPEYLTLSRAIVTEYPLTMMCWLNTDDDATYQCMMYVGNAGATNYHQLVFGGSLADKIRVISYDGAIGTAVSSVAATANTWHHATGVFANATSRAALLDGRYKGTNAGDITPINMVETNIATRTGAQHFSGRIADARIYNRALTDTEVYECYRNPWELYRPVIRPMLARAPAIAAAIMNQIQFGNLGADLYDGTLI